MPTDNCGGPQIGRRSDEITKVLEACAISMLFADTGTDGATRGDAICSRN